MEPVPSILAILLCDAIIDDRVTGKKTLVGVFDAIWARDTPYLHPSTAFYARLTDGEGLYAFRLELRRTEDDTLVAQLTTSKIAIDDRLSVYELALQIPSLPLPSFGRYEIQLHANDIYVGHVTFRVVPKGAEHAVNYPSTF